MADSATKSRADIEEAVAATIQRHGLFADVERVAVAFSGGPDSTALLLLLKCLAPDIALFACHVDHGMQPDSRGVAIDAEAIASAAGVACVTVQAVWQTDPARANEAQARVVRYAALARLCADVGADALAVGHTYDDRAETVLLNLVRGAGLDGMSSMRPRRRFGRVRLVRPLVEISRAQAHAYCGLRGAQPLHDPTNADLGIGRNRVRHEVLPALEKVHPSATRNIARAAAHLDQARRLLADQIDPVSGLRVERGPGWIAFPNDELERLDPALKSRAVRGALEAVLDGRPPSSAAVDVVIGARGGSLPGTQLSSRRESDAVVVLMPAVDHRAAEPVELSIGDRSEIGSLILEPRALPSGRLTARTLRTGDRVPGSSHTLLDQLGRAGVPRRKRERALCVLVDGTPACALGVGFFVPELAALQIEATYASCCE